MAETKTKAKRTTRGNKPRVAPKRATKTTEVVKPEPIPCRVVVGDGVALEFEVTHEAVLEKVLRDIVELTWSRLTSNAKDYLLQRLMDDHSITSIRRVNTVSRD